MNVYLRHGWEDLEWGGVRSRGYSSCSLTVKREGAVVHDLEASHAGCTHVGTEIGEGGNRRNKVLPGGREGIPGFRAHKPQQRSRRHAFPTARGEGLGSPSQAREHRETSPKQREFRQLLGNIPYGLCLELD